MINNKLVILVVCFFISFSSFSLMAGQEKTRGKILKFSGDVEVVSVRGDKRSVKKTYEPLKEMDTIVTKKGGRVVMRFDDGTLSSLDEKSRLRVEKTNWFSYLGGKIYFTFKKVFGKPRHVRTQTATIGVRGTTFIISENDARNGEFVALKEGLLEVKSTGPAFEIHKTKIINDFSQFKQQQHQAQKKMQEEFEQFKKHTQQAFVEYRRNFTLQPNRVISLSGYRVDETPMTEANKADFALFESEAGDLIEKFRLRSQGLIAK